MKTLVCLTIVASLLTTSAAFANGPNSACKRFRGEIPKDLSAANEKFQAGVTVLTEGQDFFRRVGEVDAGARLIEAQLAGYHLQFEVVVADGALGLCEVIGH